MQKSALTLAFVLVLVACGPGQPSQSVVLDDSTPVSPNHLTVAVTHQASGPEWRVEYTFAQPVAGFLPRPFGDNYRTSRWQVKEPSAVEWKEWQDTEFLAGKNGVPFSRFTVEFDRFEDTAGYPLLEPFSDGSVGIHTGHLGGYQMVEIADEYTLESRFLASFQFMPKAGEQVALGGTSQSGTLSYEEETRSFGLYVYFGNLAPKTEAGLPFLIDPAVAADVRDAVVPATAKAYRYFVDRFGALPFEPSIYVTHVGDADSSNSAGGSAAWGQFFVHIYGAGNPSELEREVILNAMIHETSHFWNALAFQGTEDALLDQNDPESGYSGWIWEGGAQALTLDAMRNLNLLTKERYAEKVAELPALCGETLGDASVLGSRQDPEKEWAPYHCGEMLQYIVVELAQAQRPRYDVFQLWKDLFAASSAKQYTNDTFFQVVRDAVPGIADSKIATMKRVLTAKGSEIPGLVEALRN